MGWDFWLSNLQGMTAALTPLGENIDRCIIIIIIIVIVIIIIIIIIIIICHQPLNVEMASLQ